MDWLENQNCLRCNKGGKLLVCNEKGCPIVVHDKCLGCRAQFDDAGNFCCPYCVYKRVTVEMCQLREKAMLAREVLSAFINEEMAEGDPMHKQKTQIAQKELPQQNTQISEKELLTSSAVAGNGSVFGSGDDLVSDDFGNHALRLKEHRLEERSHTCISSPLRCEETDGVIADKQNESTILRPSQNSGLNDYGHSMMMVIYQPHLKPIVTCDDDHVHSEEITQPEAVLVAKRVKSEHLTEVECQDEYVASNVIHAQHLDMMPVEENTVLNNVIILPDKRRTEDNNLQEQVLKTTVSLAPELQLQSKFNKGVDTLSARFRHLKQENSHKTELQNLNNPRKFKAVSSATTNSRQHKQPSEQLSNLTFQNAKRSKRFWTPEEEDMLKEGVQKFSTTVKKNLPWRKILEFGRHIFDASRTPTDLKDKWRKM